jgi:heme/copper-type cytochrome/quinol oxidase subunit 2
MSPRVADFVFWIAAACCVVAQLALVRSAIRSPMTGASDMEVRMPRRWSEVAWTIVPAIGLVFLLAATWRAMHQPEMTHEMPNVSAIHHTIDD